MDVHAASASRADASPEWQQLTSRLVSASSLPFTVLVLPQVAQNYANMAAGNSAALAAISWVAYATGLAGNALMCTHLAARREQAAVRVQLIGIASGMLILGQLRWAGVMPTAAFGVVAAAAAATGVLGVLRAAGAVPDPIWRPFELLVAAGGVLTVPQVLWSAFSGGGGGFTPLPSLVAAAAAALWLRARAGGSGEKLAAAAAQLPGWLATAMFALSPVPQLVRNFSHLSSLQGLSLGTMHLALLGNALCVPRALCSRDGAWAVGTTWGCLATGWAQLLCMYLGRSPDTGARFLAAPHFAAVTAVLLAYWVWVMRSDAAAKQLASPWGSYPDVLGARA